MTPLPPLTDTGITLPPGIFTIDATVDLYQRFGTIRGSGRGITILRWIGPTGLPMFRARDCSCVDWMDFSILGSDVYLPSAAIYLESTGAGTFGTNEHCGIRRVNFGRTYTKATGELKGALQRGIWIGGPSNTNNDSFTVEDCQLYDCSIAGMEISNPQSVWGSLRNVNFDTCFIGLDTRANIPGCNLTFNRNGTDIRASSSARVQVCGYYSEHAALLWDIQAAAGLIVDGGRAVLQTEMLGPYWAKAQCAAKAVFSLRNLVVEDQLNRNYKLQIRGSSSDIEHAKASIKDCVLPNGNSDAGYTIVIYPNKTILHVDIEQWDYKFTV